MSHDPECEHRTDVDVYRGVSYCASCGGVIDPETMGETVEGVEHGITLVWKRRNSDGRPWKVECSCGYRTKGFASRRDAEALGENHLVVFGSSVVSGRGEQP